MIPQEIIKGTPIFYASQDGLFVREFKFARWLGLTKVYARTTTNHEISKIQLFLTKREAKDSCILQLKTTIEKLKTE